MKLLAFLTAALMMTGLTAQAAGRDWSVNPTSVFQWVFGDKYEPTSGSSKNESSQVVYFEFGKNWGIFEAGPILTYSVFDGAFSKSTTTGLGVYARYNFVPNTPGTMLVPFVRASYAANKTKDEGSGTSTTTDQALLTARGGVTWFPVNDFVAIEGFLQYSDRQYRQDSGNFKFSGFSLNGAFAVYF